MPCLTAILHVFFAKIIPFFYLGSNDRFHIGDVQRDLVIPSYVLLAPFVSSPCLDANEEIDLRVIGSSDCWSLHMC